MSITSIMLAATSKQAAQLKAIGEAIKGTGSDALWNCTSSGIILRTNDANKKITTCVEMKKEGFQEYGCQTSSALTIKQDR